MSDLKQSDSVYNPEIEMLFNGQKIKCGLDYWAHLGELITDGDEIKIIAVRF